MRDSVIGAGGAIWFLWHFGNWLCSRLQVFIWRGKQSQLPKCHALL